MSGSLAKGECSESRERVEHTGLTRHFTQSALKTLCVALGLFVSFTGCSKESKPVAEDPKVPPSSNTEVEAAAAPATPGATEPSGAAPSKTAEPASAGAAELRSKVSEDSFELKVESSGTYKVGTAGQVQIVLDAKSPFKVNQEYPYSFSLKETAGLKYASMKVTQDAVKLELKRATMTVPFTPSEAGSRTISGTFKFSVCTEEQCLIKKEELALAVTVE